MKLTTTTATFEMLRHIPAGSVGAPRGNCEGCGMSIWSEGGYRVPGLPGIHCSIKCIETVLFGHECCRWCGCKMDKPYSSIDSRLCSRDCSEKYYAQVMGDKTARLGSGKRFLLWLEENRPAVYRQLLGKGRPESGYCQNPECPNGEGGQPGSLALMRAGARYCNAVCRRAAQRVLNPQNRPSNRRYLCGNKRGSFAQKAFTVNSPQQALIRGISAESGRDPRMEKIVCIQSETRD
jgi:hypothetical protein